jgi:hypothetical protein
MHSVGVEAALKVLMRKAWGMLVAPAVNISEASGAPLIWFLGRLGFLP